MLDHFNLLKRSVKRPTILVSNLVSEVTDPGWVTHGKVGNNDILISLVDPESQVIYEWNRESIVSAGISDDLNLEYGVGLLVPSYAQ